MFDAFNNFELPSDLEKISNDKIFKLLLVENNEELNSQLTELLSSQQYKVLSYQFGSEALECLDRECFDLVLLNVDLPDVDGFELVNYVRSSSNTPVIMLSTNEIEERKLPHTKHNPLDYITKPYSFTDIFLRIESVLKRTESLNKPIGSSGNLVHEELVLHKYSQTVTVFCEEKTKEVQLTPIQFKLLWTLVHNKGQVQTKPNLYQKVLDRDFCQYDRSLDMHLSRIRKKLIAEGMSSKRIKTVHGKGYLLT